MFFRSHLAWVQEEWASRKSWWPSFHFSYFWAKSDWKEEKALAYEKAVVAGILLGKGTCFFFLDMLLDKTIKKLIICRLRL